VEEKELPKVAEPPKPEASPGRPFQRALCADDLSMIRSALLDTIRSGLAQDVRVTENGYEFLVAFQELADAALPVDLVILDVEMPVMDGINAATSMRAIEQAMGLPRAPILFFTSMQTSPAFFRALEHLSPARHLLKGDVRPGKALRERISQAVGDWRPV
jgi:CheY-like chemotaxis protein